MAVPRRRRRAGVSGWPRCSPRRRGTCGTTPRRGRNALAEEDHPTTWIADRARRLAARRRRAVLRAGSASPTRTTRWTRPRPWCDRYDPADVLEMLPEPHPEEFDAKPPLHRGLDPGHAGAACSSSRTRAAPSTRARSSRDDRRLLRHGEPDRPPGRARARRCSRSAASPTTRSSSCTTDHGEFLGHHQMIFKGPIHYDDLLRVPLLVRGPGIAAGTVVDDPVGTIDVAPTLLAAAGLDVPDRMEGRPLFDGPREHTLTENDFDIVYPAVAPHADDAPTQGHRLIATTRTAASSTTWPTTRASSSTAGPTPRTRHCAPTWSPRCTTSSIRTSTRNRKSASSADGRVRVRRVGQCISQTRTSAPSGPAVRLRAPAAGEAHRVTGRELAGAVERRGADGHEHVDVRGVRNGHRR